MVAKCSPGFDLLSKKAPKDCTKFGGGGQSNGSEQLTKMQYLCRGKRQSSGRSPCSRDGPDRTQNGEKRRAKAESGQDSRLLATGTGADRTCGWATLSWGKRFRSRKSLALISRRRSGSKLISSFSDQNPTPREVDSDQRMPGSSQKIFGS